MCKKYAFRNIALILVGLLAMGILAACVPIAHDAAMGDADHNSQMHDATAYTGPVTEIAIRSLNEGQDVAGFAKARDTFIDVLKEHPGANVDREFAPFVDFLTFAPPEPPVFIGMTEYENMAAFESASSLFDGPEAQAFIATFTPEVFAVMRPLDSAARYDLATVATEPGQVLEVAVRALSAYENFDAADYETKRDAFLDALSQQAGWVAEMQWVSLIDPNIVVGMTVYESAEAFQAIYASEFGQSQIAQDFGGGYPVMAGYAAFDARGAAEASASSAPTVAVAGDTFFPESVAIHDGMAYVSAFFSGEIQQIDLASGETSTLTAAGADGVIMGWGVWYDDANDVLLACGNKNKMGPQAITNVARAIDTASDEVVEAWDLPAGAMCNAILTDGDGNIYNDFYLILEPGFDNWISILEELQALDGYGVVLPGHGQPDDTSVLAANIDYRKTAKARFAEATGPEAFKDAMLEEYPNLGGAFFWELVLGRLYPPSE